MPYYQLIESLALPYIGLILFTGGLLTIRLKFFQFSHFFPGIKLASGALDEKSSRKGISSGRGFFAGSSSSMVSGTIVGTILAYSVYGSGVLLWIILFTPFLMAIQYASATLAVRYKQKNESKSYVGGPPYFIDRGLKARWLGWITAAGILAVSLIQGNLLPVYILEAGSRVYSDSISPVTISVTLSIFTLFIVVGGITRTGYVAKAVFLPSSILMLGAVVLYMWRVPASEGHFVLFLSREIQGFSSADARITELVVALAFYASLLETGSGKYAAISGSVRTDYAAKQGLAGIVPPLISALVALLTALVLFYAGALESSTPVSHFQQLQDTGGAYLNSALVSRTLSQYPGIVALFLSGFFLSIVSGITGWAMAGSRAARYLGGQKAVQAFVVIFFTILLFAGFHNMVFPASSTTFIGAGIPLAWIMILTVVGSILVSLPVLVSIALLTRAARHELRVYLKRAPIQYQLTRDLAILLLVLLPKNFISRTLGSFTYVHLPRFLMVPLLQAFARVYRIDVDEAELQLRDYPSLNRFFTRALKKGSRLVDRTDAQVVSPVDGRVSQFGRIKKGKLIQAKHIRYDLEDLIVWDEFARHFHEGSFIVLYLSPQDYHRIHTPHEGDVIAYEYSPGKLFTVNDLSVHGVHGLFPKNERLTTYLKTDYGLIGVVKVGAVNVGKIRVVYDKITTNRWIRFYRKKTLRQPIYMDRGAELGRFEMGSTVILLLSRKDFAFPPDLQEGDRVRYGQPIGSYQEPAEPQMKDLLMRE